MRMISSAGRLAVPVVLLLMVGFSGLANAQNRVTQATIDQLTGNWPGTPREVAGKMITKYGLPNEATPSMLVWHDNGPWKRTIIYRDEIQHNFPKPHTDLLEQFVDYRVPPERFDDLAAYDGSVIAERTKGEISARCDKEGMNFLALNLADDIVNGRRSVADARRFYAETAMATMRGENPPYVQGLRFTPHTNSKDPDRPFEMEQASSRGSAPALRSGESGSATRTATRKE